MGTQVLILMAISLISVFILGRESARIFKKEKVTKGKCYACGEEEELIEYKKYPKLCKKCFYASVYYAPEYVLYNSERKLVRIK